MESSDCRISGRSAARLPLCVDLQGRSFDLLDLADFSLRCWCLLFRGKRRTGAKQLGRTLNFSAQ
jgi:hypothetical protein